MNIGKSIQSSYPTISNPTPEFRAIIAQMQKDLRWYKEKYPEANTERRQALIDQLDAICTQYEQLGAIDVWGQIWKKLIEAKDQDFDGDIAVVYFPLKPNIPEPNHVKQVIIDGCGFNFDNPHLYSYLGTLATVFVASEMEGV